MKQNTSWKKARKNPPATFHLHCPLGRSCCTAYPFEKYNWFQRNHVPLEIRCLGHFLNQNFSPGLASDESCQKQTKTQRWQLKGLGKKLRDGKEHQHLLVPRVLFHDLSPQLLLEKERVTVSYRAASVERGQYRKWKGQKHICWWSRITSIHRCSRNLHVVQDNRMLFC